MKKTLTLVLILALLLGLAGNALAASVVRSPQKLTVNGEAVYCDKYNIDGSNYFKLRDLAQLLNGTGSQFDVGWDEASKVVSVTTQHAYTTPNGHELEIGEDLSATAVVSPQTIMIDGAVRTDLTVYNIGGSNFFKLRELGDALGFDVDYVKETDTATVASRETPAEIITLRSYQDAEPAALYDEKIGKAGDAYLSFYMEDPVVTDGIARVRLYIYSDPEDAPEALDIALYLYYDSSERKALPTLQTVPGVFLAVEAAINVEALIDAYGFGFGSLDGKRMQQDFVFEITDSSGEQVLSWWLDACFTVVTLERDGPDGTQFSFRDGWDGMVGSWRYIGGVQVGYESFFTLCTGEKGGQYTMTFPLPDGTADVETFSAEPNSVYKLTYTYGLSGAGSQYDYNGTVLWSGPDGESGSFDVSFSGGDVSAGYLSAEKQ